MSGKFIKPDFSKKDLELRFENNIICIYGTSEGLKKIADLCMELVNDSNQGHIHLEDSNVLTDNSLKGALAIFGKEQR
jgi:ABC-type histidine transport system ATPase subunit